MEKERRSELEKIKDWLNSKEAEFVIRTLFGIELMQHGFDEGFEFGLGYLYMGRYEDKFGIDIHKALSPEEQIKWFEKEIPIKDIRHAAFYIPQDTTDPGALITSNPDEYFYPRELSKLEKRVEQLEKKQPAKKNQPFMVGMTYQVKENGWKIFDPDPIGFPSKEVDRQKCAKALVKLGHFLVRKTNEKLVESKSGQTPPAKYKLVG